MSAAAPPPGGRRRVSLLGATGSIGRSTLDVVAGAPESFEITALAARSDLDGQFEKWFAKAAAASAREFGLESSITRSADSVW